MFSELYLTFNFVFELKFDIKKKRCDDVIGATKQLCVCTHVVEVFTIHSLVLNTFFFEIHLKKGEKMCEKM